MENIQITFNMMSIYPQALEAWFDYYNNGFKHISGGSFMRDFIAFFKNQDSDSHFECFNKFYQEKFPHFTIIQMINYHKTLNETEFNEFFESSPSKIQRDFIDFCYSSIEKHHFGHESLWIMPEDAPGVLTDYGNIPPFEEHPPAPPGEEDGQSDVWFPQHNQDSQLYDEETDDEMPPLIDFDETDAEIPQGNPIAISGFMTAELPVHDELFSSEAEMPPLESDEETTFDEMPKLDSGEILFEFSVLI